MVRVRLRSLVKLTASTYVVVLVIYCAINFTWISEENCRKLNILCRPKYSKPPLSEWLPTVVQPGLFQFRNENFDCTTAVLMKMTFPVCHYTFGTDQFITGPLLSGTYYEAGDISRSLRLLRSDWSLQLVDIGANIGLWSLPAARVTQVLAVEPNWHSMSRLAKAVDLGAVSSNITLVHNAVSDVRRTFHMGVDRINQGNAFLINATKCIKTRLNRPCNSLSPTRTILLNDLVPLMRSKSALLKVDVEGHEFKVFTNSSAGKFFDQIDVPVVFVEWEWYANHHPVAIVRRLLDFFYSRKYTAFSVDSSKLNKHYTKWPENILFKKRPYIHF